MSQRDQTGTMLKAAVLSVTCDGSRPWPQYPQGFVQGWLYDSILREALPLHHELVHDFERPKPLTSAVWHGPAARRLWVRITALDPMVGDPVLKTIRALQRDGGTVRFGPTEGRIDFFTTDHEEHPLAGATALDTRAGP